MRLSALAYRYGLLARNLDQNLMECVQQIRLELRNRHARLIGVGWVSPRNQRRTPCSVMGLPQ